MKDSIKKITWLVCILFAISIIYILKTGLFDSVNLVNNSYNRRLDIIDNSIVRGKIISADGVTLAESIVGENTIERKYPYNNTFSHVIGYTYAGKSALEANTNFILQKLNLEIIQRFAQVLNGSKLTGNSVATTINYELQKYAVEVLGSSRGAAIAIEPSTGKILCMVSNPSFDPNEIEKRWSAITSDERSSLLNRATQGLYPPGSTFKIVTAVAAIESGYSDFNYVCTGKENFDGYVLHCYEGNAHGEVDIEKAFTVSCNTYFAKLGEAIGDTKLAETAEAFLFNKELGYPLEYTISKFNNKSMNLNELTATSMGQGLTVTSPLQMVMVAAAVANGGLIMKPYIIDYEIKNDGKPENKRVPEMQSKVSNYETMNTINEYMKNVVATGTGTRAQVNGVVVSGKTGTAENSSGEDHAWFIGFAPSDNPTVAVAVILENGGAGSNAAPVAGKIIEKAISLKR